MQTQQANDALKIYYGLLKKARLNILNKIEQKTLDDLQILFARNDFVQFCHMVRPYYKWQWFHIYIMERLQSKVLPITDYDITHPRYLLRVGDQHGKSEIVARLFLSWCLGRFPNKQLLYLTYDKERAKEISPDIINILIDPIYKKIFPEFMLADELVDLDRQAIKSTQKLTNLHITNANSPKTGKQGKLILGGLPDVLGLSGDIIVCDDTLTGISQALSPTIRDKRWRIFGSGVLSRQQKNSIIIVTGTWWHREDIIGRIQTLFIDNEKLLEEGTAKWELTEFNSQKDHRDYPYDPRKFGEYLWPEERLQAYLDQKQANPLDWAIKHQNLPLESDSLLFKHTSFRIYDRLPTNIGNMKVIISIDSNYKVTNTSDHAGIGIWAIYQMNAYLLEYRYKKYTLPQLLDEAVILTIKYPNYYAILVEEFSQGQPFIDMSSLYGLSRVQGFNPQGKGDKRERAHKVLPIYDAGQVHLPNEKIDPSINFFINQHLNFTGENGSPDDLVDEGTQLFMHFDYLFRGVPAGAPQLISRQDIQRGNIRRLQNSSHTSIRNRLGFNR